MGRDCSDPCSSFTLYRQLEEFTALEEGLPTMAYVLFSWNDYHSEAIARFLKI